MLGTVVKGVDGLLISELLCFLPRVQLEDRFQSD